MDFQTILDAVPEQKKEVAESLIEELSFMMKTMEKLKADIDENGTLEDWSNGSQSCRRENPSLKSYTAMLGRYNTIMKSLLSLVPNESKQLDEMDEFMRAYA